MKELARRRLGRWNVRLDALESFAEEAQRGMGQETPAAAIAALPEKGEVSHAIERCLLDVGVNDTCSATVHAKTGRRPRSSAPSPCSC
jgi:hypothetical protein